MSKFHTFGKLIKRTQETITAVSVASYKATKTGVTAAAVASKQAYKDTKAGYNSK